MKQSPRAAAVLAAALVVLTGPIGFSSPASAAGDDKPFAHTFTIKNGKAVATITATRQPAAPQEVTLVSYFAPRPQFEVPQYVFQSRTQTLTAKNGVITLVVDVPGCNTQVDLFFGGGKDILDPLDGTKRYGDRKLGEKGAPGNLSAGPPAWFNGGDQACVQPAVQPVALCDGSVDLQLSNNGVLSRYEVAFAVNATGFSRSIGVAPGKGATVHVPAGAGPITVSAPQLPAFAYTWARPDTCLPVATTPATTTPATPSTPATTAPTTPATPSTPATATPSKSVTPSRSVTPSKSASAGPGPVPGKGGGDGELPLTGSAATGIAGGGLLLVVAGAVLFLVARRRRVNFNPR